MKRFAWVCVVAALLAGCAAQYRLSGESWGYDGTMRSSGFRAVAVFEGESLCSTRRHIAIAAGQATVGECERMTLEPPGQLSPELYWGFGMPTESGFVLFRDKKTCELIRPSWPLAQWQKTDCQPLMLKRGPR